MLKESPEVLTAVRQRLAYVPESGDLIWRNGWREGEIAGTLKSNGYVQVNITLLGRVLIFKAHRLCWALQTGCWPTSDIDHINHQRNDNRWSNLREASRSQNIHNMGDIRKNLSGRPGVYRRLENKKETWRARIMVDGKTRHLGSFDSASAASAAYGAFKQSLTGLVGG